MHLRAFLITSLIISVAFAPIRASGMAVHVTQGASENALNYLATQQAQDGSVGGFDTSPWVAVAVRAAGQDPEGPAWTKPGGSLADYLRDSVSQVNMTKATEVEKFILGLVAVGEDPSRVSGIDLVAQLESLTSGGQIGDGALLNDDFWGVLALAAAGRAADEIVASSALFIKSHQNADGGWGYAVGVDSDPDDTAAAIQALISAGVTAGDFSILNALNYLHALQSSDGGIPSYGTVNSSTDAWVVQAVIAAGQDPEAPDWTREGSSLYQNLLSFGNADGSYNWTNPNPDWADRVFSTALAVPALAKQANPIGEGYIVDVRVEGSSATVWAGKVFVSSTHITDDQGTVHYIPEPTAIGALSQASKAGGFPFIVHNYAFGLFVSSINNEAGSGASGWEYRVNWVMAQVGADSFVLQKTTPPDPPHTGVLWYWGDWNSSGWTDNPLNLELDKTDAVQNQTIIARVSYFNGIGWLPAPDATILFGPLTYRTDENGEAQIAVPDAGTYTVWAEKAGYVRSGQVQVEVSELQGVLIYSQGTSTTMYTVTTGKTSTSTQVVTATVYQISPALTRTVVSYATFTSTQTLRSTLSYSTTVQLATATITKTFEQQTSGSPQSPGPQPSLQYTSNSGVSVETVLLVIVIALMAFMLGRKRSDYF